MPLSSPNTVTVGFAALEQKRRFMLFIEGSSAEVDMPPDFKYNYSSMVPNGLYQDGMMIFAYEPKDPMRGVRGKADMLRYREHRGRLRCGDCRLCAWHRPAYDQHASSAGRSL